MAHNNNDNTPATAYMHVIACQECGQDFSPAVPWQKFCNDNCRDIHHNRRRQEMKSPPTAAAVEAGEREQQNTLSASDVSSIRPRTKLQCVAVALCRGERLDCFMAVRRFHDYVLRSTISELEHRYGVHIHRVTKVVPGFTGKPIHCAEYWVDEEGAKQLAQLLGLAS